LVCCIRLDRNHWLRQAKFAEGVEQPAEVIGPDVITNVEALCLWPTGDVHKAERRLTIIRYPPPRRDGIPNQTSIQIPQVRPKFIRSGKPRQPFVDRFVKVLPSSFFQGKEA